MIVLILFFYKRPGHELHLLTSIDNEFYARGLSAMDSTTNVLRGRPHGGTAILWRKNLSGCKIIETDDCRLMCFEYVTNSNVILFINVYIPCDIKDNLDEFLYYLAKINSIIEDHPSSHSCIIGDFNANITKGCKSLFGKELVQFCESENFVIADALKCDESAFTFFSDAHNSVSWLDHIVVSSNLLPSISNINVDHRFITSDHFPVFVSFDLSIVKVDCNVDIGHKSRIPWDKLSNDDIIRYGQLTESNLKSVIINHVLLLCDDVQCSDPAHINSIDRLYLDISESLISASQDFVKDRGFMQHKQVPGWKDYCSASHAEALSAFLHWSSRGKPRHGPAFDAMKQSRAYFKFTLRQCRADEDRIRSDILAKKLLSKKSVHFWKEVNKLKDGTSAPLAYTIDNTSGQKDICLLWRGHYESILLKLIKGYAT